MEEWTAIAKELGPWAMLAADWAINLGSAILILVIGWILSGWMQSIVARGLRRVPGMDSTLVPFLSSIIKYLILIITLVAVLGRFGVQTASIIAVLGAAGLAIGLALQGTLQNIAAGVMLLLLRPFRAGDFITAGSVSGTVMEVGLFTSALKTADGISVMAPNSQLWNTTITNFSRNPTRRMDIVVGISYGDDIDAAMGALLKMADGDSRCLREPAPQAMVTALGDNAVEITLRIWAMTGDFWALKFDFTKGAKLAVEGAGCSIPFPQQDIHVVSGKLS